VRRTLGLCLSCILLCFSCSREGLAQGSLYYRYGDNPGGQTPGEADRSGRLQQGLNQAFGGASSGVVGGGIGTMIPPAQLSEQRLRDEQARAQALTQRWQQLKASPPTDPSAYLQRYNEAKRVSGLISYELDKNPDHLRAWVSNDGSFKRQIAAALYDIRTSHSQLPESRQLQEIGEEAVTQADRAYADHEGDTASFYFSIARASANILVGIDPVTGTLRGVYESVTGINLITGDELSDFARGVAVFSVVTLGYGGEITKGIELFGAVFINSAKDTKLIAQAITYARLVAAKFASFRGADKVEEAAPRFIGMLVEAGSGPRQRAEALKATYETVATATTRSHPELYRLEDTFVKNLSLGEATRAEADAIGHAFVGENATVTAYRQDPSIKIFRSADQRRIYREPMFKDGVGKVQANLEVFAPPGSGRGPPLSDAHIDIK
jgi:Pre-toxin TG